MHASEFNVEKFVDIIEKENGTISEVYFVACGGSLVDLYSSCYFINRESSTMTAEWITSKEFVLTPPKKLGKHSVVIICSHGGNTKETVEAAELGVKEGAFVITYTHTPGSACDSEKLHAIVYDWEPETLQKDRPLGLNYSIINELIHRQEPEYKLYEGMKDGITKCDAIIRNATKKFQNKAWNFAEHYYNAPFLYIMASGSAYAQAYGFAICSLQEMQWMDCCYLDSAEYFHGPFEVTDKDHIYILLKSVGKTRMIDERAEVFLNKYAEKYEIIDAADCGMDAIDDSCVDYFNAPLFYEMSVLYRTAIQNKSGHPLDMRRYMGVVEY